MNDARQELERGLELHQAGRLAEAEAVYRAVLDARPGNADAQHFLGLIAHQRGDHQAAEALVAAAIEADGARPTFHLNLGAVRAAMGRLKAAAEAYQRAADLDPDSVDALRSLGSILGRLGRFAEAEVVFRAALALQPAAELQASLAATLHRLGRHDDAVAAARAAIATDPGNPEAHTNLGNALQSLGRLDEAEAAHRTAIAANPDYATAHYNLGNVLAESWRLDEAMACYRSALACDETDVAAIGNYLLNSLYEASASEERVFADHRRLTKGLAADRAVPAPVVRDPVPGRRLRVGYLSPDFRTHSCAYFIEPLFRAHDRDRVEVHALSNVSKPDGLTDRFRSLADHWHDIAGQDDDEAAAAIAAAGIDILVDLAGFTRGNRAPLIARRCAPVQVSWLGYPCTLGMAAVDYRLTDAVADPPGEADRFHSEELVRLDGGFLCYAPPDEAPAVTPPPAAAAGRVTFGSFNNLLKITPEVIDCWSRILREVPGSRLLLKGRLLDHEGTRARIAAAFAEAGIGAERLVLHDWIPRDRNPLSLYGEVDVALDTFPYNGTTTTLEALWMGVPVITLAGRRHASRVGASILRGLGLDDLVCGDHAEYVARAVALADNPAALAERRAAMRGKMSGSSICDEAAFARSVEAAYGRMWRRVCA